MYRNSNLYICSPMKIWRNFSQKYVTLAKLLPNLPNNRYTWGYITYKFDLLSCRKMSIFYIRPFNLQPEKWFWGCHLKFFWVWSWKKKSLRTFISFQGGHLSFFSDLWARLLSSVWFFFEGIILSKNIFPLSWFPLKREKPFDLRQDF